MSSGFDLSVVVVAERWRTLRGLVESLGRQGAPERIELVVATPDAEALGAVEADAAPLGALRLVETAPSLSLAAERAEAVRAASAPIVFVAETHVFAHAGFVEALLAGHARGAAAVAPAMGNANPDGALSWAALVADYGHRVGRRQRSELSLFQSYNVSFEREALLAAAERLVDLLSPAGALSGELRTHFGRLVLEPAARIDHLNVSTPRAWIADRYLGGRSLGEARARRWPAARRVVYAVGSPLIPLVLLVRIRRRIRSGAIRVPRGTAPAIVAGTILYAAGELTGYLLGGSTGERKMRPYELDKVAYDPARR